MSKEKHEEVSLPQEVNSTFSNHRGYNCQSLFLAAFLGSKPGKSISIHIHTYCSVTKDGNESFITRVISNGIQKLHNNFLNEQFWKSVSFLRRSSSLEEHLG